MTADTEGKINKDLVDYVYANFNNIPKCLDYELMLLGLPYDCFVDTLLTARTVSHENAVDYDKIRLKDYDNDLKKLAEAKYKHLHGIFGRVDPTVYIEAPFYVDYGCNISIGKNFFANFNAVFLDCALIEIGDNVLLGPNVTFTTATHPTDPQHRLDGVEYAKPITVGNNVWFGANIVVLPGVTIGDGAVVGAGATVTKDVPANSVVVGCPAKVVKTLKPADDKKLVAKEVGV